MIERMPFGRTGHESTRIIFGAAALGAMRQDRADRLLELILELTRPVVDDDDRRLLLLPAPDGEPDLVACLVVLRLNDTFRSLAELGPFGDRQDFVAGIQVVDVEDGDAVVAPI